MLQLRFSNFSGSKVSRKAYALSSTTDDTFSSGYIGLLGFDAGSYTNTFIFDNFTVTPIDVAEKKSAISNATLITESDQKRDDTQSR